MLTKKTITLSLLALLLVMSFASCASDTASDVPVSPLDSKAYLQIQVYVDGGAGSRASAGPVGGENGDGREGAKENENKISNLTLLLYQSDKSDWTDDDATIAYVYTFQSFTSSTSGDSYTCRSAVKEIDPQIMQHAYHALLIANAGADYSWKGKKLSDVKDAMINKVCTRAAAIDDFSDFVMSSKTDAQLQIEGNPGDGTEANPYILEATVERLAARIDIEPNATFADNGYYYHVVNDKGHVIGGFKLEAVVPTHVLTSGEYLIKRVSGDYVLSPSAPTIGNAEGAAAFYQVPEVAESNSFILDYVKENTSTSSTYADYTGLLFKGKYYDFSDWDATNKRPKTGAAPTDKEYTYTIRHSDPTGTGSPSDPMHFGIVRNNIYRIKIEGVQGDGPEGLKLTVNVRKWATYKHEETSM